MEQTSEIGICKFCGVTFRRRSGLSDHERVHHTGKAPYRCCGKPFLSKAHLTRHRISKHGAKTEYRCSCCPERHFASANDLNRHIKEKGFQCKDCHLVFRQRSKLAEHSGIHTGLKKFNCERSGKFFRFSSNFSRHRKSFQ